MRTLIALVLSLPAFSASFSFAQTSKVYAGMARATWAAFECTALASHTRNGAEQERLFKYGYRTGLSFIAALQAGKIDRKDLSTEAPWLMMLLLQGPTPDFMLGRVYEAAQDAALKNVLHTGGSLNSEDTQRVLAHSEYNSRNCQLIARGQ